MFPLNSEIIAIEKLFSKFERYCNRFKFFLKMNINKL